MRFATSWQVTVIPRHNNPQLGIAPLEADPDTALCFPLGCAPFSGQHFRRGGRRPRRRLGRRLGRLGGRRRPRRRSHC